MARSTDRCEIAKCRNVGRMGYMLLEEGTGDLITEVDLPILLCKKHLLQAIMELGAEEEDHADD